MLGDAIDHYRSEKQGSSAALPRESTITIVPQVPGLRFSPESRSFDWHDEVHYEQFIARAGPETLGSVLRGQITFFVGALILAEVNVRVQITQTLLQRSGSEQNLKSQAKPYRNIFASYSHNDTAIVEHLEKMAAVYGDRYLRDIHNLRSGENWNAGLMAMIEQADVFQVFWSNNSMHSPYVRQEWEYALRLNRPNFVRPTYWESPFPEDKPRGLPPASLRSLHFQMLPIEVVSRFPPSHISLQNSPSPEPAPFARMATLPDPVSAAPRWADEEAARGTPWLSRWFLGMALTVMVALFFWMDGLSMIGRPPVASSSHPPAPKPELVETLEEEAQNLAKDYYQAVNQNPASQLAFLAEQVEYLGHPGWSKEQVKADMAEYARKWTHQQVDLIKAPTAQIIEAGKTVECDVPLRFTSENAVVKNITSFTGRLRFQMIGSALLITSLSEVPGTRKSEALQFQAEAQKNAAIAFITKAVRSGSSDSGMTPETIADMYVEKPDYFGRIVTHADIIQETRNLTALWENRSYRVLEPPLVQSGLGTPDVEVKVGLDYHVSSPSRGGKFIQGWVRSSYLVHFSADGTPLIQKHAEIERGK